VISVIVLAYNSARFVAESVDSILADRGTNDCEIIIVDNGSDDDTFQQLLLRYAGTRGVILSRNESGLGYARGNNAAVQSATGEILLLLNDDCVLEPGALLGIRGDFAEDVELGIVQCALATADGESWESLGHFLDLWGLLHVVGRGSARLSRFAPGQKVFGAKGAALAVRRSIFQQLGGFDASFGFLFEETDLCWRALLRGFKVAVSGRAVVRHRDMARYKGAYSSREGSVFYILTRNRLRSMIKNFSGRYLLQGMPMHLFLTLAYSLRQAMRNRPEVMLDFGRAVWWNLWRLRSTLELRRRIQRTRVVSDFALMRSGLLVRPRLAQLRQHPSLKDDYDHM
jgi:GT2 family glycosyltransferase